MRIGIDTFSYHRLLGMLRPGEDPPTTSRANGGAALISEALDLGCDVVSLQTCFLEDPRDITPRMLRDVAGDLEIVLAWGHPEGLAFGSDVRAAGDLDRWIEIAGVLGSHIMRIVVGGPALRGTEPVAQQLARCREPLRRADDRAAEQGIRLLVENHADLRAEELLRLVDDVTGVGVCLDTANAARVGDDPVEAARLLADHVGMIHLKDTVGIESTTDPIVGPASVALGNGVVPVAEVLDAVDGAVRAGAPVCVELGQIAPGDDETVLIEQSLEWLRAWKGRQE